VTAVIAGLGFGCYQYALDAVHRHLCSAHAKHWWSQRRRGPRIQAEWRYLQGVRDVLTGPARLRQRI